MIDKKKWFDVPDSLVEGDNGEEFYNVQAKFADIPILNVAKSKAARHNVFDLGIVLHTKVLRQGDASPVSIKNGSSHVMRFDKGDDTRVASTRQGPDGKEVIHYDGCPGMGKDAFDAAVKDIMRCYDAWQHYQKFRQAPVHPLEVRALEIIAQKPLASLGVLIDRGDGNLEPYRPEPEDDEDEDETSRLPAPAKKPRRANKKAA